MRRKAPSPPKSAEASSPSGIACKEMLIGAFGLFALTLLIYIPTYSAGFIWDDDVIASNPLLKEGWNGLRDIWFSTRFGDFVPMTATTFWIEWQIHGAMKEIQHATNVVLQAFNAVLLWRILLRLGIPAAWAIAALFAFHPVCAASVTWLAERKNTLSMFFYLLSLLYYLRADSGAEKSIFSKTYWISFFFFLLGLLSKSSVVVLPVVLLLIAWWQRGRIEKLSLLRVAPFFGFAFAAGVATLIAHHYFAPKFGVLSTDENLLVRTLTAGWAFWFYVAKDLLPVGLTMHYPKWDVSATSLLAYLPALAIIGMFLLFWKFRRTWGRHCLLGLGYFVLALGPTIGVINMAYLSMAPVADHFQYMALPGTIALVVVGGCHLLKRFMPRIEQRMVPVIVFLVLGIPLAVLSWNHQTRMGDPEALWRDNIAKNPASWAAHNNLAGIYFERGNYSEALRLYQAALERRDNLSMVHVNVGRALFAIGKTEEAIVHYTNALEVDATDFKAHNNLGVALIQLGQTNKAISAFQNAVKLSPNDTTFFINLAKLLTDAGRSADAMNACRERIKRFPNDVPAHYQLGQLLFNEGDLKNALVHYKEAVRLSPGFVDARFGLAEIQAQLNNKAAAIAQWREILRMQPDAVPVIANLAWALATDYNEKLRNGAEAVTLAERVCRLAGRGNPRFLDLLAAAYAEAGRFPDAIKTAEEAVSLAHVLNDEQMSGQMQARLSLYQTGRPYRN